MQVDCPGRQLVDTRVEPAVAHQCLDNLVAALVDMVGRNLELVVEHYIEVTLDCSLELALDLGLVEEVVAVKAPMSILDLDQAVVAGVGSVADMPHQTPVVNRSMFADHFVAGQETAD